MPKFALDCMAGHAVDWYLMCEDLPHPESRIMVDGKDIVMHWQRSNMQSLDGADQGDARKLQAPAASPSCCRAPSTSARPRTSAARSRWATIPRRRRSITFCRAFDHPNLFVVDGSFLPTSAAVNPALSIAAQALRVADHIRKVELGA